MKKIFNAIKCLLLNNHIYLSTIIVGFSFYDVPIYAANLQQVNQRADVKIQKENVRRDQTMRENVFRMLDRARQLSDAKDNKAAIAQLKKVEIIKRNQYEKAMTWNMLAYVYFNQADLINTSKAYENVLKQKNIPIILEQATRYSLAKIYLLNEKHELALKTLNDWFAIVEKPNAEAYILKAQIYYQLKQYHQALSPIKIASKLAEEKGKKTKENWLLLERAIYYENKDYPSLSVSLKQLIEHYPKAQYFVQLSAVYNELKQPEHALVIMMLAYEKKLLNRESHLLLLSNQLISKGIPFKAAKILERAMNDGSIKKNKRNLTLLADAWLLAKEYDEALQVMQTLVSKLNDDEAALRLAQIYIEKAKWQKAFDAAKKAIDQGGLEDKGHVYFLQAYSLYNLKRYDEAEKVFDKAGTYESQKTAAAQWKTVVKQERERQTYLSSL